MLAWACSAASGPGEPASRALVCAAVRCAVSLPEEEPRGSCVTPIATSTTRARQSSVTIVRRRVMLDEDCQMAALQIPRAVLYPERSRGTGVQAMPPFCEPHRRERRFFMSEVDECPRPLHLEAQSLYGRVPSS